MDLLQLDMLDTLSKKEHMRAHGFGLCNLNDDKRGHGRCFGSCS